MGLNDFFFSKSRPEECIAGMTTVRVSSGVNANFAQSCGAVEEIDHSGLCTAPLFTIRLVLFEIQMIEISILAGDCRM